VLRAARLFDGARATLVRDAVVVVTGDRITAAGPATLVSVPAGARVIDLGDATLMPGLIDAHVHITGEIDGNFDRPVKELPAMDAFRAAYYAERTLMAGFTTVRVLGVPSFTDVALGRAVEEGLVVGPRIVPAAHSIGITGGHCDVTGYAPGVLEQGPEQGVADGPDAATRAVRYQIKHGAQVIKICATAGVLSFEGPGRDAAALRGGDARDRRGGGAPRGEGGRARARHRGDQGRRARRCRLHRARLDARRRGGAADARARHVPGAHAAREPGDPPRSAAGAHPRQGGDGAAAASARASPWRCAAA
jgi:hypothetical protein